MELKLIILITCTIIATASIGLNLFLITQVKRLKKKGQPSYEVNDLLHDLTAGRALIRVERVAPADFFLRSPFES